jgi:hemoglobin
MRKLAAVVVVLAIALAAVAWPALTQAQGCAGVNDGKAPTNFGACVSAPAAPAPSLYRRLGGRDGIGFVVGDFVTNMAGDPRVNARFKDLKAADVERLKSNLADQICEATGGPCSYLGRDMKTTHKGMNVTEAEWTATVENLAKALEKNKVGAKEQQELVGVLAPLKKDIVGQ